MSNIDDGEARHEGRTHTGRAVVLVVVVAVIAIVVLKHSALGGGTVAATRKTTTTTAPPTSTTVGPSTTTTTLPSARPDDQVVVQVLNGLQSGSLAGELTSKLQSEGYQVLSANDTTQATTTSAIYVAETGFRPEAEKLATSLGEPKSIVRDKLPASAPVPSGVVGHADLVVVIGTSLQTKV